MSPFNKYSAAKTQITHTDTQKYLIGCIHTATFCCCWWWHCCCWYYIQIW